jgi:hypothetical protein
MQVAVEDVTNYLSSKIFSGVVAVFLVIALVMELRSFVS